MAGDDDDFLKPEDIHRRLKKDAQCSSLLTEFLKTQSSLPPTPEETRLQSEKLEAAILHMEKMYAQLTNMLNHRELKKSRLEAIWAQLLNLGRIAKGQIQEERPALIRIKLGSLDKRSRTTLLDPSSLDELRSRLRKRMETES